MTLTEFYDKHDIELMIAPCACKQTICPGKSTYVDCGIIANVRRL